MRGHSHNHWNLISKYWLDMFHDIGEFVAKHSFGPAAAEYTDVGRFRFIVLQPYNYYMYNADGVINLLLPRTMEPSTVACTDRTMIARFSSRPVTFACTSIEVGTIRNVMRRYPYERVTLSRTIKSFKINELVNLCITHGICTVT